jgi:hypothetical protein
MPNDMTGKPPSADNRKSPRRRVLKAGLIAFNNRHSTLQCTVRDMSGGGARLLTAGSINAPDTFELIIELDGMEVNCAVVSRSATEVRVKFTSPIRQAPLTRIQVVGATVRREQPSLRRKPRPDE